MNGLLIIDKPQGLTSHDVVRRLRRVLKTRRVGHTGTLDPLATGVLPVAIGLGTRLVQFFLERDKSYRATLKLGEVTDTQDSQGQVLQTHPVSGVTAERICQVVKEFVGSLEQIPPMYSALKRNGTPLYKLARQGIEVDREPRPIVIQELEIISVDLPHVSFDVTCSKGTYVRTLCHDIGHRLGTGAHMTALRRLRTGSFDLERAITLDELERVVDSGRPIPVLSLREALADWSALQLDPQAIERLSHGIPPSLAQVKGTLPEASGDRVALIDGDRLVAVACFAPERLNEKRGDFELLRVFMTDGSG